MCAYIGLYNSIVDRNRYPHMYKIVKHKMRQLDTRIHHSPMLGPKYSIPQDNQRSIDFPSPHAALLPQDPHKSKDT